MPDKRLISLTLATTALSLLLSACNTAPKADPYVLYRQLMPRSILVLPPINESLDANASYSWVTTASMPIAEQGYYVFPVAVVDEFMKENGLPMPEDMHAAPLDKLGEVFGADAVLYVTLAQFGQKFELLSSVTRVNARAEMVDIKTGQVIWTGVLNYAKGSDSGGQGLLADLVAAAITQIGEAVNDSSHDAARLANQQLFRTSGSGLLLGPMHPGHAAQMEAAREAAEVAAAQAESAAAAESEGTEVLEQPL